MSTTKFFLWFIWLQLMVYPLRPAAVGPDGKSKGVSYVTPSYSRPNLAAADASAFAARPDPTANAPAPLRALRSGLHFLVRRVVSCVSGPCVSSSPATG